MPMHLWTAAKTVATAVFFCADPRNRACATPQSGPFGGKIFRCRLAVCCHPDDASIGMADDDPDYVSHEAMSKKRSFLRFFFLRRVVAGVSTGSVAVISHAWAWPVDRGRRRRRRKKKSPRC